MNSVLAPSHHVSSSLEKVLEHRFLAALTTELWLRGVRDFEVLRSEVDAHGYDMVVDACGTLRHIQLKAMMQGGKRRDVGVSLSLARKPSGCVIWMIYDPETLALGPFLWFGGGPGDPLPGLGEKVARHTKGDSQGVKAARAGHRLVPRSRFDALGSISELATALFGPTVPPGFGADEEIGVIYGLPGHPLMIRRGNFAVLPASTNVTDGIALVSVVDGGGGAGDLIAMAGPRPHGTWIALNLLDGSWDLDSELARDPAVAALLSRTIELLKNNLPISSPDEVEAQR